MSELPLDEALLRAFVDGELDADAAAQVQARLARDERAARFVQRERALRARLNASYDPVLDEPLPERLLAALGKAAPAANDAQARAPVLQLAAAREARGAGWWKVGFGLAASLVLGVFIGQRLGAPAAPLLAQAQGRWVAGAALAQALDTQGAATQSHDAPVQLALSFVARDGHYCRSFALPQQAAAGLACREGGAWQLQVLARAEPPPAGAYRQAASALPPAVLQAIDARIAGAPLDAAGEAQALQRHWAPGAAPR